MTAPPKGLSLMVWSCGPDAADRAATPFITAQAAAALELKVEMLFTAQAVQWLLQTNTAELIGFGPERLPVAHHVQACADAGVEMRACGQALAALGLARDALVQQCAGLGGTVAFVSRAHEPGWQILVF